MSENRSGAPAGGVLVRPDSPENIGLAARGMANTGFGDLRVVGLDRFEAAAWRTVHAEPVLESARFFPTLAAAVAYRELVLGSTARVRHDFPLVTLPEAVGRIREYPEETRVAFVFGNERRGLSQEELGLANIRFHIAQAARQPSYNLGVAVTLALPACAVEGHGIGASSKRWPTPGSDASLQHQSGTSPLPLPAPERKP